MKCFKLNEKISFKLFLAGPFGQKAAPQDLSR